MYAFLIWHSQLRVAFGARDPFGIKPLFSCSGPAGMAFASEKKSLLELAPSLGVSTELDRRAPQHLTLQYVPEPATLHCGLLRRVNRLGPGCSLQHVDLFTWLRGAILVKADKMTMANSLELRVLFLDPEIFRVASTIPLTEKITRETTKHALRQALRDIVPGHVLNRPKLGYPVPIRHWLRQDLYGWARSIIDDSGTAEFLDLAAVHRMIDEHRVGPRDHNRRIWGVLIFMLWHGIFIEQRIVPVVPEPRYPVHV